MVQRYGIERLRAMAISLLTGAGLANDRGAAVADILIEGDLLGHTTHGLALLVPYLQELRTGGMKAVGEPLVVADRGACVTWDGDRLPGTWLTATAVDLALGRVATYGTVTVVIRRAHHIGCLAAYLARVTERGCMALLTCSDPAVASVAPFGGTRAVFTPDPIAIGIPTGGDPILIDVSASITTNGMSNRLRGAGQRFAHPWLLDGKGEPTDDPAVLGDDPPGTILPVGGLDHGHKGYGLALMVEALTQGLGGYGRADAPSGWGASVFLQVIDPDAFGGGDGFRRQVDWIVEACRSNPPRPGLDSVRLPGHRGLELRRAALREGVPLHPGIWEGMVAAAERVGIAVPQE